MMKQVLTSLKKQVALTQMARRGLITETQYGAYEPNEMNELIDFLDDKKPTYTLLYFHAKWNPKCKEI